ncbi:unnamed protein product [Orchesella dallaii]|uniref:Gustatory receptor n=1 Tax=Orchesella dallaii TaxID=48710 RepID=A0ABP1RTV6_9HEXA
MGTQTQLTLIEEMRELEGVLFTAFIFLIYLYFTKNAQELIKVVEHWKEATKRMNFSTKDANFPTFCFWITIFVLGFGVTVNILFDLNPMRDDAQFGTKPFLEVLFLRQGEEITNYLPYHPVLSILLTITAKFTTYAWNLNDIFVIIFCRAISYKFTQLNCEILNWTKGSNDLDMKNLQIFGETPALKIKQVGCLNIIDDKTMSNHNRIENVKFQVIAIINENEKMSEGKTWDVIREKTFILLDLSKSITNFVTPPVLICFISNIYLMILQSLQFLSGISSEKSAYAYIYISYFQFTMRTILVTYFASNVYHSTEQIVETLDSCPNSRFSETTTQLERLLARHPVGISIFGAFKIRRKFFISIISFLFTTEIVILQAMNASNTQNLESINKKM